MKGLLPALLALLAAPAFADEGCTYHLNLREYHASLQIGDGTRFQCFTTRSNLEGVWLYSCTGLTRSGYLSVLPPSDGQDYTAVFVLENERDVPPMDCRYVP